MFLLGIHPYLSLYSGKLSTDVFACLAVALLYYRLHNQRFLLAHDIGAIVLAGFRNNLILLYLIFYSIDLYKSLLRIKNDAEINIYKIITRYLAIMVSFFAIFSLSPRYLSNFLNDSSLMPLSRIYFRELYLNFFSNDTLFSPFLSNLFSLVLTPIVHTFFLLGAREGSYVHFPQFLLLNDMESFITVSFFILFFSLHFVGLAKFIVYFAKKNKNFLIPLVLLLPSLYSVAHLRYFLPFIPLALLGFCLIFNKK